MKFKKTVVLLTSVAMLVSMLSIQAFAAGETATVYVTISNGGLVMAQEAITVKDIDNDGSLTVNDALYLAHEAEYTGGAAAGYGSAEGQYGLGLTKLWGVENGGSYGYYVNNASAMGLADTVKDGDYINAFVYTDTAAFSDVFCYFDVNTIDAADSVTLTLSAAGYDENWNPIVKPVEGAIILLDGTETSVVTDANGKATVKLGKNSVISAKSASVTLVPPVCTVTNAAVTAPQTGDVSSVVYSVAAAITLSAIIYFNRRKNVYEK